MYTAIVLRDFVLKLVKLGRFAVGAMGCFLAACGSGGGGGGGGGAGNPSSTNTATMSTPTRAVTPAATSSAPTSTATQTLAPAGATPTPTPLVTLSATATQVSSAATATMAECPVTTTPEATQTAVPSPTNIALTGPDVTRLGIADATGIQIIPAGTEGGLTVYRVQFGSGFLVFVEGRPGVTGLDVGALTTNRSPFDPAVRPDLQIQASRNLGNGSPASCDNSAPNLGGIPAIDPPSFAVTQGISDALNDFSCRFSTFDESQFPCTQDGSSNYAFADPNTTRQFCVLISNALALSAGDTVLTARLRDSGGNAGPAASIIVRVAR